MHIFFSFFLPYTKMTTESKLDLLLQWFDQNKISWDKDALEIKQVNGSFGVYAKKKIESNKPGKYDLTATVVFMYSLIWK